MSTLPGLDFQLGEDIDALRDAVRAFNVACIEKEGYEADDLIATMVREARAIGLVR